MAAVNNQEQMEAHAKAAGFPECEVCGNKSVSMVQDFVEFYGELMVEHHPLGNKHFFCNTHNRDSRTYD